jgi:hypothetical protein
LTLIKDIILIVAAITGSVVALKGLGTWQRQLRGQSEYELSRRILVTLFKYRNAINGVRHPAMWAPYPPEDEAKNMNREQIRFYGTSKGYQYRWDKVQLEKTSLYADLMEAEAIWGIQLKTLFEEIFNLEHELFTSVRHHIELINPETPVPSRDAIINIEKKRRYIMYDNLSEEPDEFKLELISAIEKIENYLKPKLSHK